MRLFINRNQMLMNGEQFLRRAGYAYLRDRRSGSDSFVRRLGPNFYPRFHAYVNEDKENIIFNLHLDQKQASYEGSHAHSGEYDGELVSREIVRLKQFLNTTQGESLLIETNKDKEEEKKNWWQRLVG